MTRPIAKRNGEPAYLNAPPRLRQSDFKRPMPSPKQGFWARVLGRVL